LYIAFIDIYTNNKSIDWYTCTLVHYNDITGKLIEKLCQLGLVTLGLI